MTSASCLCCSPVFVTNACKCGVVDYGPRFTWDHLECKTILGQDLAGLVLGVGLFQHKKHLSRSGHHSENCCCTCKNCSAFKLAFTALKDPTFERQHKRFDDHHWLCCLNPELSECTHDASCDKISAYPTELCMCLFECQPLLDMHSNNWFATNSNAINRQFSFFILQKRFLGTLVLKCWCFYEKV